MQRDMYVDSDTRDCKQINNTSVPSLIGLNFEIDVHGLFITICILSILLIISGAYIILLQKKLRRFTDEAVQDLVEGQKPVSMDLSRVHRENNETDELIHNRIGLREQFKLPSDSYTIGMNLTFSITWTALVY